MKVLFLGPFRICLSKLCILHLYFLLSLLQMKWSLTLRLVIYIQLVIAVDISGLCWSCRESHKYCHCCISTHTCQHNEKISTNVLGQSKAWKTKTREEQTLLFFVFFQVSHTVIVIILTISTFFIHAADAPHHGNKLATYDFLKRAIETKLQRTIFCIKHFSIWE